MNVFIRGVSNNDEIIDNIKHLDFFIDDGRVFTTIGKAVYLSSDKERGHVYLINIILFEKNWYFKFDLN